MPVKANFKLAEIAKSVRCLQPTDQVGQKNKSKEHQKPPEILEVSVS